MREHLNPTGSLQMIAWVLDGHPHAKGVDREVLLFLANSGDSWATEREIADGVGISMEQVALSIHRLSVSRDLEGLREVRDRHVESRWPEEPEPSDRPTRKPISQGRRTAVMERNEYRCVRCGTFRNLTIDHVTPVARGGTNDLDNLQTLCQSCNSKKGAS